MDVVRDAIDPGSFVAINIVIASMAEPRRLFRFELVNSLFFPHVVIFPPTDSPHASILSSMSSSFPFEGPAIECRILLFGRKFIAVVSLFLVGSCGRSNILLSECARKNAILMIDQNKPSLLVHVPTATYSGNRGSPKGLLVRSLLRHNRGRRDILYFKEG